MGRGMEASDYSSSFSRISRTPVSLKCLGILDDTSGCGFRECLFEFSRFLVGQLDFQEGESPGQAQAWLPRPWHGLSHWPHHREGSRKENSLAGGDLSGNSPSNREEIVPETSFLSERGKQ